MFSIILLACRQQVDVCFMIDLSGSTRDEYERTMTYVRQAVYALDFTFGRARVAVITYGSTATVQFNLNKYSSRDDVINALRFMPDIGRTNTQEAISRMRNDVFRVSQGDRAGVRNIGVLVTDGNSNIDRRNTIVEAVRARGEDIAMYVIALGTGVDMAEVNGVAGYRQEATSDYVYNVANTTQVPSVVESWLQHLCQ